METGHIRNDDRENDLKKSILERIERLYTKMKSAIKLSGL